MLIFDEKINNVTSAKAKLEKKEVYLKENKLVLCYKKIQITSR
jgi:hypothetical protein